MTCAAVVHTPTWTWMSLSTWSCLARAAFNTVSTIFISFHSPKETQDSIKCDRSLSRAPILIIILGNSCKYLGCVRPRWTDSSTSSPQAGAFGDGRPVGNLGCSRSRQAAHAHVPTRCKLGSKALAVWPRAYCRS